MRAGSSPPGRGPTVVTGRPRACFRPQARGGPRATPGLLPAAGGSRFPAVALADAVTTAQNFVNVLFYVYLAMILVYILMSWIPLPYTVWLNRVQRFLYDVVEPYLRIFRRVLPSLSLGGLGLDLSPIIAVIVLIVAREIVVEGIGLLH
jgi:YggT family protein